MIATVLITSLFIIIGILFPRNKLVMYSILLLLFLLFAFEYSEFDYNTYLMMYDNWNTKDTEKLFKLLSEFGNRLNLTFDQLRGLVCIFEVLIIGRFIKRYSLMPCVVLVSFFIFPAFMAAELFRWLLGMTLIIFGLNYLIMPKSKIDYLKFFICVFIAALSHSSCWFFLSYFLILVNNRKYLILSVASILLVMLSLGNTGIFFELLSKLTIREHLVEKYETGLYSNTMGVLLALFKIGAFTLLAFMSIRKKNNIYKRDNCLISVEKIDRYLYINNRIFNIVIVSSLMLIPIFFSSISARLLQIPLLLSYISYSNRCYIQNNKAICIEPVLLSGLFLVLALFIDTGGIGPIITFTSHFTEGFLIRFYETIL